MRRLTPLIPPPALMAVILAATLLTGCLLDGGNPKEELEPGPRNYSWSVDSVGGTPDMWVGWANTIWGSAPDDVWMGLTGGYYNLWHYDGTEWTPWPYRKGPDGFTGDFYSIFGFAQNDVWMGGSGPRGECIWHFNGEVWKLAHTYQPEGMGEPSIKDIWGTSSSDLYAVGTVPTGQDNPSHIGFMLHYDGTRWKELLRTDFGMQFQRIRKNKDGIFLYGAGPYSNQIISDSISIYNYGKNLKKIRSINRNETKKRIWLNRIKDNIYLLTKNKLQRFSDVRSKTIHEFPQIDVVYSFFGRNEKDVFLVTSEGLLHYNGNNTKLLYGTGAQPSAVILKKEVFFFKNNYEAGTNVIYHGTLTDNQTEE